MLTLVLTLAMLLSVMVVGAGAATFGDQESITNKEAVDVCTTLNIIGGYEDGTFRPAGNVTRAEMCKMICVALNGGKEPNMGSGLIGTFNDVAKEDWSAPYIEYCVSQGIVGGVGGGRFDPNGNITGTQAAKMLLCILGYNASIQGYVGNDFWETKINVDAAQKGLYTGLTNVDASVALTRDSAAQMIWNALNAYEVEYITTLVPGPGGTLTSQVDVRDKVVGENSDKITLLEDKYEASTYVGTFQGNADSLNLDKAGYIQVTSGKNSKGTAAVTTATFPCDIDIKYIGEEIKVLYKDNAAEGTRYAPDVKDKIYGVYVTGTSEVVTATKADIDDLKTDEQKIKIDGTKHNLADTVKVWINYVNTVETTTAVPSANLKGSDGVNSQLTTDLQADNGDTIKFVKDSSGNIDKIYVVESKIAAVTAVNSEKVSMNNGVGTVEIDGNSVYADIAKGDVVVVTTLYSANAADDDAYSIVEKAEVVSGEVTGYKKGADATKSENVTVDGTTYTIYNKDAMLANIPDAEEDPTTVFEDEDIGSTFNLYMVNGYVGAAVEVSSAASNYCLVTAVKSGSSAGEVFDALQLQVMDAEGTKKIITVSDDSDKTRATDYVAGDIIVYSGEDNDAVVTIKGNYKSDKATGTYDDDTKTFNGTVVSGDCVLFAETTTNAAGATGAKYKAYSIRDLGDFSCTNKTVAVRSSNGDRVVAVFADLDTTPNGASSSTVYGIVSTNGSRVEIDNNYYTRYTVVSSEGTYTLNMSGSATLTKGDIVAFDPAADETYAGKDVSVLDSGAVYVKNYSESDNTLTYFTAKERDASGAYKGVASTQETLALDKDCVITYVDADGDKAGTNIGIGAFDSVTGYKNALIVTKVDGGKTVITAIIVETSNKCDIVSGVRVSNPTADDIAAILGDTNVITITGNLSGDVSNGVGTVEATLENTNITGNTIIAGSAAIVGETTVKANLEAVQTDIKAGATLIMDGSNGGAPLLETLVVTMDKTSSVRYKGSDGGDLLFTATKGIYIDLNDTKITTLDGNEFYSFTVNVGENDLIKAIQTAIEKGLMTATAISAPPTP